MKNITFIGGGNMARALISGMKGAAYDGTIRVIDNNQNVLTTLKTEFGCEGAEKLETVDADTEAIVLAVKPDMVRRVAESLGILLKGQLVISIAAGIDLRSLKSFLGGHQRVVRAMPNTPALVRQGITGLYAESGLDLEARHFATQLFSSIGDSIWLTDEKMIDAITAVTGSGPAYVFYFIEALAIAARQLGFNDTLASKLALGTFTGAVKMLSETGEAPAALRERVTSKGGTTAAALLELTRRKVTDAVISAVGIAVSRAEEMRAENSRRA